MNLRVTVNIPIDVDSPGFSGMTPNEIADLTSKQLKEDELLLDDVVDFDSLLVEVLW